MTKEREGELMVGMGALLWALFPILTILSLSSLSPIVSLAWTTLLSLVFFLAVAVVRKSWVNIFQKEIIIPLFMVAGLTGITYYCLFFIGLQYTSAGNAAIIGTFEILFTFLFFNVWHKEHINHLHILGAVSIFISAMIIFAPNFVTFHVGDFFILAAVTVAPVGNMFQKKLRGLISSEQILLYRTIITTPFLFLMAFFLGEAISFPPSNIWLILAINGILLFGLTKILWVETIFRIGVTKAISMSSVSPLFTLLFAYVILQEAPTVIQLVSVPFAITGVYLLTRNTKLA
jgi:drug/metabolite transporter (DMT)-like permease